MSNSRVVKKRRMDNLEELSDSLQLYLSSQQCNLLAVVKQASKIYLERTWLWSYLPNLANLLTDMIELRKQSPSEQQSFLMINEFNLLIKYFEKKENTWQTNSAEMILMKELINQLPGSDIQDELYENLIVRINELVINQLRFQVKAEQEKIDRQKEISQIQTAAQPEKSFSKLKSLFNKPVSNTKIKPAPTIIDDYDADKQKQQSKENFNKNKILLKNFILSTKQVKKAAMNPNERMEPQAFGSARSGLMRFFGATDEKPQLDESAISPKKKLGK